MLNMTSLIALNISNNLLSGMQWLTRLPCGLLTEMHAKSGMPIVDLFWVMLWFAWSCRHTAIEHWQGPAGAWSAA